MTDPNRLNLAEPSPELKQKFRDYVVRLSPVCKPGESKGNEYPLEDGRTLLVSWDNDPESQYVHSVGIKDETGDSTLYYHLYATDEITKNIEVEGQPGTAEASGCLSLEEIHARLFESVTAFGEEEDLGMHSVTATEVLDLIELLKIQEQHG